jgi:hypothetical protein
LTRQSGVRFASCGQRRALAEPVARGAGWAVKRTGGRVAPSVSRTQRESSNCLFGCTDLDVVDCFAFFDVNDRGRAEGSYFRVEIERIDLNEMLAGGDEF